MRMGNICCRTKQAKEKPDASNPALLMIREAQRKYFHSHIESDLDDSDEDDDREDSTDAGLYDSECSLLNGEDNSLDMAMDPAMIPDDVSVLQSALDINTGDISSCVLGNDNINNNDNKDFPVDGDAVTSAGAVSKAGDEGSSKPTEGKGKHYVKRRHNAKYIRLSTSRNFYSIFNTEDKKARSVDPKMYQYPFENIVFEGGGNKGLAYCGAVKLLEELNIWPQIKRLAGTSAGAMTAALLAIGYDSRDLEQFFSLNLNNIFLDHKFGYLSLLPNLLTSYGWNPGNRIYKWFGQRVFEKTGDMDTTFKQVYERFNRELCVVVTNLNQMTTLYCHPKTTPDMPVRLAVRMSMSIPGLFHAVKHTLHGQTDIFVDGGVLCNYPIHCFDGWWLSMKPEDNFLEKLQPLEDIPRLLERTERFGTYNEKTLGMQLYSDNEQDLLKYQLENLRHGVQLQELPNTKLAREKIKKKKLQLKTDREHRRLVKAMNAFLRALNKHNTDKNDTIDRQELEAALKDESSFPKSRRLILFGDVGSDVILDYLDKDHNGQISYNELLSFMEETGISMQNRFLGYQRRNIKNFSSFLDTLQATLLTNVKRVYVEERDLKRTVGINTGHIGTSDFVLEPADIEFVMERGRRSLEAFLKYCVASNHLKKKPEYKRGSVDIRKNSKCSLISSSSNQSIDSGNILAVPAAAISAYMISPLAAESKAAECHCSNIIQEEEMSLPADSHQTACRTKSGSSGKSVTISNNIEIVQNTGKYSFSSADHLKRAEVCNDDEQDETLENDCENSECVFLLSDTSEYKNNVPNGKYGGIPKQRNQDSSLTSTMLSQSGISQLNEHSSTATDNTQSPDEESSCTSGNARQSDYCASVEGEVLVHKSKGKYESSTTPLLHSSESPDAIELRALSKGH